MTSLMEPLLLISVTGCLPSSPIPIQTTFHSVNMLLGSRSRSPRPHSVSCNHFLFACSRPCVMPHLFSTTMPRSTSSCATLVQSSVQRPHSTPMRNVQRRWAHAPAQLLSKGQRSCSTPVRHLSIAMHSLVCITLRGQWLVVW